MVFNGDVGSSGRRVLILAIMANLIFWSALTLVESKFYLALIAATLFISFLALWKSLSKPQYGGQKSSAIGLSTNLGIGEQEASHSNPDLPDPLVHSIDMPLM